MNTLTTPWPPPTLAADPDAASLGLSDAPPRRARRWWGRLAALVLIAGSLVFDRAGLFVLPLLFVLVVPFEKMFPRHRGQRIRRPGLGLDVAHALAAPLLGVAGVVVAVVVGVVSLAWLPGLALRPLVGMIPATALPFVGIALFDLAIYWVHRWSHEVPFLWKFHSVHHSTEHLDWVSGFRNHPFDGAIVAPPFVFLLAAGFDATFTGILAIVQLLTGLFLHANVRWRLRPLHRLIITPEFHHWHHANEADAHNHNYSVFLPFWDIVFGTYFMPKQRRPQVYGISEPMPMTLVGQIRQPLRGAGNPLRHAVTTIRHPWRTMRSVARFTRSVVGDVWGSTRRPTRLQRS